MNNKKVKFGIIGLGRVIEKRVANVFLKEVKNAEVVAVYDKNKKKNLKYSKIFKCKFSKNLNQFFQNKIDIVYIATESGNHYKIAMECFKNNKNVIVEKPPTLTIKKLELLEKVALKKRLDFFCIYQNRYNSSVIWVKKYLPKIMNKIISLLLLVALFPLPYSYYQLLRIFVTLGGLLYAFKFYESDLKEKAVLFGFIAILWNPVAPIYLDRSTWMILDIAGALVFYFGASEE